MNNAKKQLKILAEKLARSEGVKRKGKSYMKEKCVWTGRCEVFGKALIKSYKKTKKINLTTEKVTFPLAETMPNGRIKKGSITLKYVTGIVLETPKLTQYQAEEYVRDKAQIIADYLSFANNKHITIELTKLISKDRKIHITFVRGFKQSENQVPTSPKSVDLKLIEKFDENTIAQLSNYSYSTQNNLFARFVGSFKVIEISDPKNEVLVEMLQKRHLLSHGKVDSPEAVREAMELLSRKTFRPTFSGDREKLHKDARDLQEEAREILSKKIESNRRVD